MPTDGSAHPSGRKRGYDLKSDYQGLTDEIVDLLGLSIAPLAITFHDTVPDGVKRFQGVFPPATEDGRTGAVPAGCVFWAKGLNATFATEPEDHANCSVGSLTHGLITLEEAASRADVKAVCEANWVQPEIFPAIPTVNARPAAVVYGPLAETRSEPDVVLLRLVGKQVMQLHAAMPSLRFEGKPQCHIVAIAKEQDEVAVSVGCMLSRVRTGMSNNEVTCAIPGSRLSDVIASLREACEADRLVASYASEDGKRFA